MIRKQTAVLLLSIQALLLGWMGWSMCPNKTEVGHMAAAVYFWHTLRFDVFHVNPPLTRIVAGLPVILCGPEYDWSGYSARPQDRSEWTLGESFLRANPPEKLRWYFAFARWSLIPLVLLGGVCGYRLSRDLYGNSAGLVWLVLWCFCPMLLDLGASLGPDAVAASLGVVAIYAFHQWLHKPSWTRSGLAGLCLGLLPFTKLTWIIAFAIWPLIWCLWRLPSWWTKSSRGFLPQPPLRQLAAILLVGLHTLNIGYLFDGSFRFLKAYASISQTMSGKQVSTNEPGTTTGNRFTGTWLGEIPVPLPVDFFQGIDTQRYDFERGLPSYLRGEWADHGWWYYYLYALAIKVPLGTWCLVTLAIGATIFGRGFSAPWRDEMVVLV